MKKFASRSQPWGEFVDVKINAPTILKKQLKRTPRGSVLISSVTDAYQPIEKQYEVTRKCLHQFLHTSLIIRILTKSSLVVRDIDVLKSLKCEVGFTFTTMDEQIKSMFEPGSSSIKERLSALKTLSDAHIPTYAFFGPLIPLLSDTQESLESMFAAVKPHVRHVIVDRMNFYDQPWKRIRSILYAWNSELVPQFNSIRTDPTYNSVLRRRIQEAASVPVEFCF
jgi:DNA repair photolyase